MKQSSRTARTPPGMGSSHRYVMHLRSSPGLAAGLLGVLSLVVYLTNLRPMGAADSIPARLIPFSLVREGNVDLDEFAWLRRPGVSHYFLIRSRDDHWVSTYPLATSLPAMPLVVPAGLWLRAQQIEDDDVRFRLVTLIVERLGAAGVAALSVALLFLALHTLTSPAIATAVTLTYAFGTSMWAISSQAMWQHGLAALSLAGLSFFLLRPDTWRGAVAASVFAALGVAARPTMLVFALLALCYMWRERRAHLLVFLAVPIVGAALLLGYNWSLAGRITGGYGYRQLSWFRGPSAKKLMGLLISPSRGLLIYTPAAILALPAVVPRGQHHRTWVWYLAIGIVAYVMLYGSADGWWGGHTYGPRLLTDIVPAVALCAVGTVERLWRSRVGATVLAILAAWGITVQVIGVYFDDNSWNVRPGSVDREPQRRWDWRDPQILRAAQAGWHGTDQAALLWQMFTNPVPALLRPLSVRDLNGSIVIDNAVPRRPRAGSEIDLQLTITNNGGAAWPVFADYGFLHVTLLYSWWSGGVMLDDIGGLIPLRQNLGPGDTDVVKARIDVPVRRGEYTLQLTIIQLFNPELARAGDAVLRVPVTVR